MGSVRIVGAYNPAVVGPNKMSPEMAKRVEARRIAEQGRTRVLSESQTI